MSKSNQPEIYHQESNFSSGLFWGLALGICGTFLFATKEGKKIRQYLSQNSQKIFAELEEFSQETEEAEALSELKELPPETKNGKIEKQQADSKKSPVKTASRLAKLQQQGRAVSKRFFSRSGKALK